MADKEVGMLPGVDEVTDETLIPAFQPGFLESARKVTGEQFRRFAQSSVAGVKEAAEAAALRAEYFAETLDSEALLTQINMRGNNLEFDPVSELLYLTANGVRISDGIKIVTSGGGGGGGGGSSNNAVITATNTSGFIYKTISAGSTCKISLRWKSVEENIPTGPGALTVTVNGVVKHSATVEQGNVTLDVAPWLGSGSSSLTVTVSDVYGNSRSLAFTINVVSLVIESLFDDSVPQTGAFDFTYTPRGETVKTVTFLLDGKTLATQTVTTSNRPVTYTIPAQSHGAHILEVYFTAYIGGEAVTSNRLKYAVICTKPGNNAPIFATTFAEKTVEQYDSVAVTGIFYLPDNLTADIIWRAGGEDRPRTVDRSRQTYAWTPSEEGKATLAVLYNGAVVWSHTVTVEKSVIDAEAETNGLELYLTSHGRSNNEPNPAVWEYGDVKAQFSGFNWVSDGWIVDDDGLTVMRVSGNARLTIPAKLFAQDFRSTGKTIEIEFATRDVRDYDAVICSCWSGGRGILITTQAAKMASEQSAISTQYKDNEHIRLSFVVQKEAAQRLVQIYLNGILSGVVQYPVGDDFSQLEPVNISIGSSDATIDLYSIRSYHIDLNRWAVLDNWISDTRRGTLKMDRWRRNEIYDDYGNIVIKSLPTDLPYLILSADVLPQFKGDKKACSGQYIDPIDGKRSFTFSGAEIDVQGTSSQYYYVKNYKIKFKGGFVIEGKNQEAYQMNDDAIPTDTFTFKADVASSEGANNVVLAKLYNQLCPVKTPPQQDDPRVRQTIDGHPIVVFWDDGVSSSLKFLGKYNFNNDKGTEEVFGFEAGDESWEILQNGTDRVGFKSADFSGTGWQDDFEARYPDKNTDPTKLAEFAGWIASTYQDAATGNALSAPVTYGGVEYVYDTAAYRLAKFRAELPDWASVDALVFYYVFTELVLAIDQREKNAFPTVFSEDGKWLVFFYDADSTLGIDNKGNLTFDYWMEDIDYTAAGEPVFNGQGSVLWVNLRQAFAAEIEAEYKRLRTDNTGNMLSYETMNAAFEEHQSKWPEAIINEDGWRKYIEPLELEGNTTYLPMLQGIKELQRQFWLYNRFRYLDSKYRTGSSETYKASIRTRTKGSVWLTPYISMYGHVAFNNQVVSHRMQREVPCEFVWEASGAEDAVVGISSMDLITSLGDLSPLLPERVEIAQAIRLVDLKLGDADPSYNNASLKEVEFGNNTLLKVVDLRNCSAYSQTPNLVNCINIEEVYLDGTAVKGINLPNGGNLKKLHLPATLTNLTILNQTRIEEFVLPDYSNINTLRLENVSPVVDGVSIVMAIQERSRVRLTNVELVSDSYAFLDKILTMRGLDENGNNTDHAVVSGSFHLNGILPVSRAVIAQNDIPYLTVTSEGTENDILQVWPEKAFVTADGKIITFADGGHVSRYTGAEVEAALNYDF